VLVVAALHSVVVLSSETKETNTANNMAIAGLTTYAPKARVRVRVSGPSVVHAGKPVRYRVSVTGSGPKVQVCSTPPERLAPVRPSAARGGSAHTAGATVHFYRGRYCLNIAHLRGGRTVGFTLSGVAGSPGRAHLSAEVSAAGLRRPRRASRGLLILAPIVACPARAHAQIHPPATRAVARAAC
jgi:hypothetical protein